jgi:hypothetical protein
MPFTFNPKRNGFSDCVFVFVGFALERCVGVVGYFKEIQSTFVVIQFKSAGIVIFIFPFCFDLNTWRQRKFTFQLIFILRRSW